MLEHVEKATDYSDDDSTSDSKKKGRDSDDSINTNDIEALTDSDDETEEETLLRNALEKIIEFKNKNKNL